ncbi:carbonic anhydrase family protein [Desemzia sp. RIT804]|uniref:carbonic anhydrase family protein n=1 Tax=Desemzia sp. RIT 804 TaxID=2810209 RepID=UPI00194EF0B5|nr:carbonic anhydrase family protein [Desemzia sp. RIT 804]MBM6613798.1 carbonic anhydrase family protein [Desemzia sp. RIT 804]
MKWSYSGKTGPECWSSLCPDFQKAETETKWQSPILLMETAAQKKAAYDEELIFMGNDVMRFETDFFNHTIHLSPEVNQEPASVTFQQKQYMLEDIHAHLPSEHVIDGNSFDLEIHFVHRSADNEVLVVGVMGQARNGEIQDYLLNGYQELLAKEELKQHHILELDLERLRPENRSFFHYSGSLTTPPTIGPVQWIVMKNAILLPIEFIEAFKMVIGKTNRPLQAAHDREITLYE